MQNTTNAIQHINLLFVFSEKPFFFVFLLSKYTLDEGKQINEAYGC